MELWLQIYEELVKAYDSQLNKAILEKIQFKELLNNETFVLIAPDHLTAGWFNENFLQVAKTIVRDNFNNRYKFRVDVAATQKSFTKVTNEINTEIKKEKSSNVKLEPWYTFINFIVGSSNDFAYAAAQQVAQNPGKSYNPLFIYGNSALGKTHLLQSIMHQVINEKPDLKAMYVSSEKFTNEFLEALSKKDMPNFRGKYRQYDFLIIDDIQFFQGKDSTLNELFQTFEKLKLNGKQMVFACDRPPMSLSSIESRLRTRFESGLTVEIKSPDFETRKAILINRANKENIKIPHNVIDYIAKNIEDDVRVLEGSLIKVIAYSNLKKKEVSLDLVSEILRDKIKVNMPKDINVTDIQKGVSRYFGLATAELKSESRKESVAYPRQIAMYLAKAFTSLTLSEIGDLFGGKAHTTVLRSTQKISELVKNRGKVKKEVEDIISSFYERNSIKK